MIRHGHGGSLGLPKDQSWRHSVRFRFNFDTAGAKSSRAGVHDLEADMREAARPDDPVAGRDSASLLAPRERLGTASFPCGLSRSLLRRIGDLCLIDEAVVMDLQSLNGTAFWLGLRQATVEARQDGKHRELP